MKYKKGYEVEINLKDLLFNILYKWRLVLIFALVMAGVFGFCEYWNFEKYHRSGELTPAEIKYETDVEANKKALEQANNTLSEFESLARDKGDNKVSILMGIDPTNIWTAEKKYLVNLDDLQPDANFGIVVNDSTRKILTILSEAFSVAIDDKELYEVFGTNNRRDIDEIASICINPELKTLSVVCCGATKEEAEKYKEYVNSYLLTASEKLSRIEKYSLEELSDSIGTKMFLTGRNANGEKEEKDLAVLQSNIINKYQNYQNQIALYTQTRNNLLAQSFTKPEPKIKSQALFGFMIGAFLTIIFFTVTYLVNGKLKTSRELKNRYDLSLLGEFTHSRAWWKGKGLDWIWEKLEFGKKTDLDNELNSIALLIDEAKDGKSLLLTGSLEEQRLKVIYDGLASRLKEQGIELVLEPDYLHNSEAVAASRDLDSVLLVEEKYKSRVRDLDRMAEMLEIEEANVIGAVLI